MIDFALIRKRWFSSTSTRLALAVFVLAAGFLFAVSTYFNAFKQDIYKLHQNELMRIISLAKNNLEPVLAKKAAGELSLGEARLQAAEILERFTYNDSSGPNSVFLTSYDGYLLVDPFKPNAVGTYQMHRRDAQGVAITQELLRTAQAGGGFVMYNEARTSGDPPQKKLSYVVGVPEIECYLGTGMYIGDIDSKLAGLQHRLTILGIMVLLVVLLLQFIFVRPLLYSFSVLSSAFKSLRANPEFSPHVDVQSYVRGTEAETLIDNFKLMLDEINKHRESIKESEERFRLAAQAANDVIWDWNGQTQTVLWSSRIQNILGYTPDSKETHYEIHEDLVHPDDRALRRQALLNHFNGDSDFYACEYRVRNRFDEYRWVQARGKAITDSLGMPCRMIGSLTDITEQKLLDDKMRQQAYSDPLTKLPNRAALEESLDAQLELAANGRAQGALMFIDLNDFKRVNDIFGHSRGDKLLTSIAGRLHAILGERGKLYRLGGDEFVVLLPGQTGRDAELLAQEIIRQSTTPYTYQDETFNVTASIGIAVYPQDGLTADSLLGKADLAMYHAKEARTVGYASFLPSMQEAAIKQLKLESLLGKALARGELSIHYQPQIDIPTGRPVSIEALLRWKRPDGYISPRDFIPIAEQTGLILPIGRWVLTEACKFCRKLHDRGLKDMRVAVNISPKQIEDQHFMQTVYEVLAETGLSPQYLELEITESLMMRSLTSCIRKLNQIVRMGVKLALDDFGTGYSSLTYLRHLPINIIKIDKGFIDDIKGDRSAIVETIIRLAQAMNLKIVAEGIEDNEQLALLSRCGCDRAQGYYISHPVSPAELISWLDLNISAEACATK